MNWPSYALVRLIVICLTVFLGQTIAYAEKQLGHKLGTPTPVRQSGTLLPVAFDDESVNTKIDSSIINCMIQSGNKNDECTK